MYSPLELRQRFGFAPMVHRHQTPTFYLSDSKWVGSGYEPGLAPLKASDVPLEPKIPLWRMLVFLILQPAWPALLIEL